MKSLLNSYYLITRKKIPAYLKYYWSKITPEIKTKVEGIPPLILLKSLGKNLINYLIYGNSVQDGTPTPSNPVEIESVGDLVTDTNDINYGKYKIPVKVKDTNNIVQSTTNIYLDEPLRKIGNYSDYIDFENSKVVRNISNIDLGTLNWRKSSSGNFLSIDTVPNIHIIANSGVGNAMTTIYKETKASNVASLQGDYVFSSCLNNVGNPYVRDISKIEFTAEEFKVAISGIIMYYVLNIPTEETILLPNIPTIKGTTIFEIDTEIQPSKIEVDYLRRG